MVQLVVFQRSAEKKVYQVVTVSEAVAQFMLSERYYVVTGYVAVIINH